ncbi:Protein obstructor-E [Frankliniella fusca]|uniref:Protein obstructor-E n=1 Tax=Frankliniella fusca TaxID=407009 RepID=A0AAE1LRX8_9NEOP|nr:Protein obstructor-E [Frankliniella fusca]
MFIILAALLPAAALAAPQQSDGAGPPPSAYKCPEPNGVFPDPYQCDLYYKCTKGVAEEKLCPDGLVFDDEKSSHERCDLPANVECGERKELQEPKSTKECPRANGYFRHNDPTACDKFVNCVEGVAHVMPCPPGLIYDDSRGTCSWPHETKRECGVAKRDALEDGFSCPEGEVMGPTGRPLPHPTFPHAEDCQKFYICRNGVDPQHGSCPYGEVYNEETFKCDEPANVQGCEKWYENGNAKPPPPASEV